MNAVSKHLLRTSTAVYSTRAIARRTPDNLWALTDSKTKEDLGTFDFLVCTDKTAAQNYRNDLDKPVVEEFVKPGE